MQNGVTEDTKAGMFILAMCEPHKNTYSVTRLATLETIAEFTTFEDAANWIENQQQ